MLEDEWLKIAFKGGSNQALRRIYEKYRDALLTLAMALLNDSHGAEDVVHDVFATFAQSANGFRLRGNLKSYLNTCVANRAKDRLRGRRHQPSRLNAEVDIACDSEAPVTRMVADERSKLISAALATLPYEQREAIALHLNAAMTFRQIAKHQEISVSTAKGRYRYGLQKLRSSLNGRLKP